MLHATKCAGAEINMLRIGVLGAGDHAMHCHGPALAAYLAKNPGSFEPAAVCDLQAEHAQRFAAAFGFKRTYTDSARMLAEEKLDGVIALTPVEATRRLAGPILERGLPVVVEKPPGQTITEARQLIAIAEAHHSPHMVSFNRRFNPAIVAARHWLAQAGADRPPRFINARMLRYKRQEPEFVSGTGIHLIDAVLSLLGPPVELTPLHVAATAPGRCFQATLRFPGGAGAQFLLAPEAGVVEETYEILGPEYRIFIDVVACAVTVTDSRKLVLEWRAPVDAISAYRDGTLDETAAFIQALGDGSYHPTLPQVLPSMLAAEAFADGRHWMQETI
jgi:myo-inositol 2-dehydrogenase / D-chiro-inositol 1-dehydrogenase